MKTVQATLNDKLDKGESIADWAIGYYDEVGGEHCPDFKIAIFQFIEQSKFNTMVLIDYLGSMMWINSRPERVHYGWGGENSPSPKGKELRRRIEAIKSYNK